MTSDDHGTFEAARTIRFYLADWPPDNTTTLDDQIADLLNTHPHTRLAMKVTAGTVCR